jgi:hypothetical protein
MWENGEEAVYLFFSEASTSEKLCERTTLLTKNE